MADLADHPKTVARVGQCQFFTCPLAGDRNGRVGCPLNDEGVISDKKRHTRLPSLKLAGGRCDLDSPDAVSTARRIYRHHPNPAPLSFFKNKLRRSRKDSKGRRIGIKT